MQGHGDMDHALYTELQISQNMSSLQICSLDFAMFITLQKNAI